MLKIIESPDPILNQKCEECDLSDESLGKLAQEMAEAMYENDGVGIAAPQVGVLKRLIVVDCNPDDERDPLVLVNPKLMDTWGTSETEEEGCLSCPGISIPISRKAWARVRYYDLEGVQWEIESDGLLGRCLQHEIDHLNGITLFESASPRERIKALKAYEEARRAGAKPGEVSLERTVR